MSRSILLFGLIVLMFGGATAGVINIPSQYSTIQAGIDAAVNGDTVLVADSTYYENINFKGKAITVASHFLVDGDTTHINNTIIDGSQPTNADSGSVVSFASGEDTTSVLCGFTITSGTGTLINTTRFGGGICIISSGATILYNRIVDNYVDYNRQCHGGGIAAICDTTYKICVVKIIGNTISNNKALSSQLYNGGYGGGMDIVFCNVYIGNNIISYNKVSGQDNCYGAGIRIEGYHNRSEVINNLISLNAAINGDCYGGGLLAEGSLEAVIQWNRFEGNHSHSGGGLLYRATGGSILQNTFINNLAKFVGGGLEMRSNGLISGNTFIDNSSEGYAGGISVSFCSPHIYNNIIIENKAEIGGGIYIGEYFCGPLIINNTIVDNTANIGGGIYTNLSWPLVMNTILWGNIASTDPQIHIYEGDNPFPKTQVVYSDIQGGLSGLGNINEDPQLSDSLTLLDSSPCIGAGIDTLESLYFCPATDLKGNNRPSPYGSMPDIGAIESPLGLPTDIQFSTCDKIPHMFSLRQNYPNPFNPSTAIEFALPKSAFVTLKVYNLLGEEVATLIAEQRSAGIHNWNWDARGLASGVYLYRLGARNFVQTKKFILLR